jgi:hypothetical protein
VSVRPSSKDRSTRDCEEEEEEGEEEKRAFCGAHRHKIEEKVSGSIHSILFEWQTSFFFFFFLVSCNWQIHLLLFSDINNKHLQVRKNSRHTRQVPNCATAIIIGRENARVRGPPMIIIRQEALALWSLLLWRTTIIPWQQYSLLFLLPATIIVF